MLMVDLSKHDQGSCKLSSSSLVGYSETYGNTLSSQDSKYI